MEDNLYNLKKLCQVIYSTMNFDVVVTDLDFNLLYVLLHTPYSKDFDKLWPDYYSQMKCALDSEQSVSCAWHELADCSLIFLDIRLLSAEGGYYVTVGPALTRPYSDTLVQLLVNQKKLLPERRADLMVFFKSKPFFTSRSSDAFWISYQLIQRYASFDSFVIDGPMMSQSIFAESPPLLDPLLTLEEITINYELEKKWRTFVSAGDSPAAKKVFEMVFNSGFIFQGTDNPFRVIRNLFLSINTLCCAAAYDGGVLATDLHSAFLAFSLQIENADSAAQLAHLCNNIFDRYCDMVIASKTRNYSPPVKKAVVYLHNHYDEAITLSALAKSIHYSEGHLSRKFHQETGKTLIDYLNGLRVENACRLLEMGTHAISDVALQVGFSSYTKFSIEFKKRIGKSATAYLKGQTEE